MSFQWCCSSCTYQHTAPSSRCVMCGNLRNASTQEMVAFIEGRTQSRTSSRDEEEGEVDVAVPIIPAQPRPSNNTVQQQSQPQQSSSNSSNNNARRQNPYASGAGANSTKHQAINPYSSAKSANNPYAKSKADSIGGEGGTQKVGAATAAMMTNNQWQQQANRGSASAVAVENQPPNQQAFVQSSQELFGRALPLLQQLDAHLPQQSATARIRPSTAQNLLLPLRPSAAATAQYQQRPPSINNRQNKNNSKDKKIDPFVRAAHRPQVYQSGPVPLDAELSKDWIYPVHPNFPVRDYQLEISQTAIQYNTLVSLPTGLGKTLIAAVVLYNYYRWFPVGGKVVFLAPTLPLVDQQIRACYGIMGIPAEDTAVLNGKVPAAKRSQLWKERRVFFCTPQTVEKDMEAERCPAKQIVCLVLDEAHKATGNFAYTKVVELCEAAGAHLRILGLSATPGAKVQQVQKVIDALRITRLEARSEEEVKQYIHERHNEIVVVKKRSLCHAIEQQLNALIAPIMKKLRTQTSIGRKVGPNDETLTSFSIHLARQFHHENTGDHRHDGYFIAAQKLIDARANLFSHGIGSVRGKLLELRNNPQRGVLATIVKGEEFQAVVDAVIIASSGKHSQETAEDKKGNNPKLAKLDEILQEHFLRAEASKSTTRAIVFSQWRDSVGEIVDVLSLSRPLIRPRYFVGQSSGSGNKPGAMKGMPQKVQQQTIQKFQEGIYNVLVCTCIGEEGLDIGEVDLIVNYDTLRSPIRMIQRVGRTGRKRDGRVVCLVSEGQEQKDMAKSKNNERSLQRALRKPDNFKLRPNQIMFPQLPKLFKKDMIVTEKLRLSQVGGHAAPAERKKKDIEIVDSWKLTDQKENIRFQTFGKIEGVKCSTKVFPLLAKRKLLRARMRSYANISDSRRYSQKAVAGASRRLLMTVEVITEEKQESTRKFRNMSDRDSAGIFPLEDSKCRNKNAVIEADWDERLPLKATQKVINELVQRIPPIDATSNAISTRNLSSVQGISPKDPKEKEVTELIPTMPQPIEQLHSVKATNPSSMLTYAEKERRAPVSPAKLRPGPIVGLKVALQKTLEKGSNGSFEGAEMIEGHQERQLLQTPEFKLPTPPVSSSESEGEESYDEVKEDVVVDEIRPMEMIAIEVDHVSIAAVVKLPTPPPSSDESESEGEEEGIEEQAVSSSKASNSSKEVLFFDTNQPLEEAKVVKHVVITAVVKLPTPPVSSSESENEDEEEEMQEQALLIQGNNLKLSDSSTEVPPLDSNQSLEKVKVVWPVAIAQAIKLSTPAASSIESASEERTTETGKQGLSIHRKGTHDYDSPKEVSLLDHNQTHKDAKLNRPRNKPTDFKTALEVLKSSGEKVGPQVREGQGLLLPTQESSSDDDSACSGESDEGSVHIDEGEDRRPLYAHGSQSVCCDTDKKSVRESSTASEQNESIKEAIIVTSIEQNFVYTNESVESPHKPRSIAAPTKIIVLQDDEETDVSSDHQRDKDDDLLDTPSVGDRHKRTQELPTPKQLHKLVETVQSSMPLHAHNEACSHNTTHDEFNVSHESPEALPKPFRARSRHNVLMTQQTDGTPIVSRRLSSWGDELTDTPTVNENNSQGILVDTPVSSKPLTEVKCLDDLVDTPQVKPSLESRLSETQDDDADDIVCLVCRCGDSNDDLDPIVLCDGVKGDDCLFAAHTSCYSLESSVISLMKEWRCDICERKKLNKSVAFREPSCFACQGPGGALKLTLGASKTWFHPYCMTWVDEDAVVVCNVCSFPGATTCDFKTCSRAAHPHCVRESGDEKCWLTVVDTQQKRNCMYCPKHRSEEHARLRWKHHDEELRLPMCFVLPSSRVTRLKALTKRELSSPRRLQPCKRLKPKTRYKDDADNSIVDDVTCIINDGKRGRVRQNLAKRHRKMLNSVFIDTEAGIDADDDMGGDDEEASEVRQLDEEEELAAMGFINDSSQLGYSQDELDRVEPEDIGEDSTTLHRIVDVENERKRQFSTPIFNRRMKRGADSQESDTWAGTPNSANRSSLKGLGNCNFIRSVIEHARKGGDAEDVEAAYHEIAEEVAQEENSKDNHVQPVVHQGPLVVEYIPSDEDDDNISSREANSGGLTAELKAVIARKRLEALARLKRK